MSVLKIELKTGEKKVLEKSNISYVLKDNQISFVLDKMKHIIDIKEETFLRENEEYAFFLDIKNKKSEIKLKKEEYILQVEVEYAILLKNKNEIKISYLIETDDEIYNLVIELEEGREK